MNLGVRSLLKNMGLPNLRAEVVVQLTRENMVRHEARFGKTVVIPIDAAGFYPLGGGITPSSAERPKTCGLALALVALFCYFPGISMVASVGRVGITNQTAIGIVFMCVAGTLTAISVALCLRSRQLSMRMKKQQRSKSAEASADDATKALLSNREQCCTDGQQFKHSKQDALCERDEIQLANRIEQSFTLHRYFSKLDAATGPFDLDHEGMDRITKDSMQCGPRTFSVPQTGSAKKACVARECSLDSAICVDSDPSAEERGS